MESFDKLCMTCAKVDLFSLFTGPRCIPIQTPNNQVYTSLGTLAEVNANTNCPLCRLLKHDLFETDDAFRRTKEVGHIDPSKVRIKVRPFRVDYVEEIKHISQGTIDMLATILEVHLSPMEGPSTENADMVGRHLSGNGIQLLSPDFVDPARPLLNGYQATTMSNGLDLLRDWMDTCVELHPLRPEYGDLTCCRPHFRDAAIEYPIRVIDVKHRTIVERSQGKIEYAALSYVWGTNLGGNAHTILQGSTLPERTSKVIEDAIFACKKLSIPYLWVDYYCIDREDRVRFASEIDSMGYRYHYAKITVVAVRGPASDIGSEVGLLPVPGSDNLGRAQRVETVQGRKYVTALPSILDQLHASDWLTRAWTMQEGQLSVRCAFFGKYDISFMCGLGHRRESLHSGIYGHKADIPNINMACKGHYTLSWLKWRRDTPWLFNFYSALVAAYTTRDITFESDRIKAITGCLNFITETKGMSFIHGLPTRDFHYALLWTGENDRPREGFPSWTWSGWHSIQQCYLIEPSETGTCSLEDDAHGNLQTVGPVDGYIELAGIMMSRYAGPYPNVIKCSHRYASISLPSRKTNTLLAITSEIAHFSLGILAYVSKPLREDFSSSATIIPWDFDSTRTAGAEMLWDLHTEYVTPSRRLFLGDDCNNAYVQPHLNWYDYWPPVYIGLPKTLRGETLAWLLKDGIELIMILELKSIVGVIRLRPFHIIVCIGVNRSSDAPKGCGVFVLPKEVWDKARPQGVQLHYARLFSLQTLKYGRDGEPLESLRSF